MLCYVTITPAWSVLYMSAPGVYQPARECMQSLCCDLCCVSAPRAVGTARVADPSVFYRGLARVRYMLFYAYTACVVRR